VHVTTSSDATIHYEENETAGHNDILVLAFGRILHAMGY
jgi:hypothetical protein